ncbi:Actin-like protein arp9 (SWI/SNF complex component arp9) [Myotisia sp. PD_48]|nr:Actin-like protein arp9 (SWI/SNF complex component arp9) [Myotisia sp. PD_48]
MPPFKDEHILIIAPGSQTTLAQLGLPESFTPARFRFPTRMFPGEKKGEWEPHRICEKVITAKKSSSGEGNQDNCATDDESKQDDEPKQESSSKQDQEVSTQEDESKQDVEMEDTETPNEADQTEQTDDNKDEAAEYEEFTVYEEDKITDDGAVYALHNGAIANWSCFFALLTHIYNALSPPFHTPIILISQPAWTARDKEKLTQFVFEKFKTPAFCLMDSALAVCYAYGAPTATIIDVGHGKADVSAVSDFMLNEHGRGIALEACGGQAMTDRLLELLQDKGFTRDMCEQLKRSNICEILPAGTPLPKGTGAEAGHSETANLTHTSVPGTGPEMIRTDEKENDDGVLDVATIVSGNASEYLARREKEKVSRKAGDAAAAKLVRLPNSKKPKASFYYEDLANQSESDDEFVPQKRKRELEVGVDRFLAATPLESKENNHCGYSLLDIIAAQVHHTILSVADASKRSELWDSLIILGNGSKIKGFPQALLSVLTSKYVLSPSSGTIFTSEIPSTFSTPLPTGGTNTPAQAQNPGPLHHPAAHGVNPLLVAATHANNPAAASLINQSAIASATDPNALAHSKSTGHSQTPTSIKFLKPPEYFPEWKAQPGASGGSTTAGGGQNGGTTAAAAVPGSSNVGMEEAVFLGAQVAAKVVFVLDQGVSKGCLTRVEYNEVGPMAIHDCAL